MTTERRKIRFEGRVQGVGFRATVRSLAAGFAVSGWVRNEPDGSVVAEIQGEPAEIERLLEAVRTRMARNIAVEHAAARDLIAREEGFEIRR